MLVIGSQALLPGRDIVMAPIDSNNSWEFKLVQPAYPAAFLPICRNANCRWCNWLQVPIGPMESGPISGLQISYNDGFQNIPYPRNELSDIAALQCWGESSCRDQQQ